MNIHPMLVHFPIAFLTVYGMMELIRLRYITSAVYWFYIKATLVIIGAIGAGAAYLAGKEAAKLWGESKLIETHASWAKLSVIIFAVIATLYALAWLSRLEIFGRIENYLKLKEMRSYTVFKKIINYAVESLIMPPLALVGLASITITGALGGAIVYGPDVDPIVRMIYNIVVE